MSSGESWSGTKIFNVFALCVVGLLSFALVFELPFLFIFMARLAKKYSTATVKGGGNGRHFDRLHLLFVTTFLVSILGAHIIDDLPVAAALSIRGNNALGNGEGEEAGGEGYRHLMEHKALDKHFEASETEEHPTDVIDDMAVNSEREGVDDGAEIVTSELNLLKRYAFALSHINLHCSDLHSSMQLPLPVLPVLPRSSRALLLQACQTHWPMMITTPFGRDLS